MGAERVLTVPQFNLWTLQWNADRIAHLYRGYWDAPIFWPLRGTFARSEAQSLTGALFAALRPIGGNVGAYNLTLWALLALNGLAMTWLARRLGAAFVPALLAGALAQTLPFIFNELGVLQLVPLFPLWMMIERLVAYRQRPRWNTLAGAGTWIGAMALISGYYALFTLLALVVLGPVLVIGRGRRWWRVAADIGVAAVAAAVIALPFLIPQQANTAEERWRERLVYELSARPIDSIQRNDATLPVPWAREYDGGQALFPGGFALALAAVGLCTLAPRHRRVGFGVFAAAVLLWIVSLGLRVDVGGFAPYGFLRDHVAGFDRLRSPFRAAVMTQALLVVLAALGLGWMWRRPAGRVLAIACVVASVAETVHWNQPTGIVPRVARFDWVQWLDDAPEGSVAMVPFPASGSVVDYEATTTAMLAALEHGHPLLNGYTGLFPMQYRDLRHDMEDFPDATAMDAIGDSGARYLVLRHDFEHFDDARGYLDDFGWQLRFAGDTRDVWERATTAERAPSSPPASP
jgi:hypothetical protein